jgi:hypothetical protein
MSDLASKANSHGPLKLIGLCSLLLIGPTIYFGSRSYLERKHHTPRAEIVYNRPLKRELMLSEGKIYVRSDDIGWKVLE